MKCFTATTPPPTDYSCPGGSVAAVVVCDRCARLHETFFASLPSAGQSLATKDNTHAWLETRGLLTLSDCLARRRGAKPGHMHAGRQAKFNLNVLQDGLTRVFLLNLERCILKLSIKLFLMGTIEVRMLSHNRF